MITQCCIHELYIAGRSQQPAVDLAKTFERRKCNHREAIPGDDCLASVVGPYSIRLIHNPKLDAYSSAYFEGDSNKHRYIVATRSQPLRVKLRQIPAVPIIHINRSVVVLEPPSDLTIQTKLKVRFHHLIL